MSTKKAKPPDPKREPVISGSGAFFSATDPAADADANLVGTIEWIPSNGTITLAVYPKDAKMNGQPVTYKTRMRGYKILSALVNSLQEFLRNRIVEYVGELGEKAREQIEDTFQIKGLNGIWGGEGVVMVSRTTARNPTTSQLRIANCGLRNQRAESLNPQLTSKSLVFNNFYYVLVQNKGLFLIFDDNS